MHHRAIELLKSAFQDKGEMFEMSCLEEYLQTADTVSNNIIHIVANVIKTRFFLLI